MWVPADTRAELRELAAAQHAVVSRDQLTDLGVTRNQVRDHVRARRWRLVGRAVVLHRGPLTTPQRHWVAVLHVGQGAALASLTAAEQQGLTGWESERVHVVVARGARVHPLPWMRIHISRRFSPDDVHRSRTPPMCRLTRAVVDAASWKQAPMHACALLAAAVQQRLATPDQLREEILGAGWIRHRRTMLRVLDDIEGGAHALSELRFDRLRQRAGLPKPERQVKRRDAAGRVRYLDARIKRPDGRVITIEIDGAAHLAVEQWWDDQARSNDVVIAEGSLMLRFPAMVLRLEPERVIAQLRAAYFG